MTVTSPTHYLAINSIPLATYGWELSVGETWPLLDMPQIRGSNRLIPGAAGMKPYLRRADETRYVFPNFWVYGSVDEDNTPYSDPFEGLLTNIEYLRENVALPKSTGDGTYAVVWTRPGALDNLQSTCHVTAFEQKLITASTALFTLEISVPSGTWTVVP